MIITCHAINMELTLKSGLANLINKSPIYQQLNKELRKLIAEDNYDIGDKFLSERTICETYEISRATANKALSSLVSEGLLEFKKGVGTFIKSKPSSGVGLPILTGLTKYARLISIELIKGSELNRDISVFLKAGPDDEVFKIERSGLADERPVVIEYLYILSKHCPDLAKQKLTGSFRALFAEKYNLEITVSEETIQAVNLSEEEAALLGSQKGKAGLAVKSISLLDEEVPLIWEKSIYRPDSIEFHYKVEQGHSQVQLSGRIKSRG